MITGINKSKTLTRNISREWKCKFDGRKCNSNQWLNNNKCRRECKRHNICEKKYIWNPATCICKNGKYLASIIDDSVIKCDEIIDADAEAKSCNQRIKTISKNIIFEKKVSTFCLAFS